MQTQEEQKMIKEAIIKLAKKEDLTYAEAEQVMNEIMEGKATDVQKSAYLTALSMKVKRSMRLQHQHPVCGHIASNCFMIWMYLKL